MHGQVRSLRVSAVVGVIVLLLAGMWAGAQTPTPSDADLQATGEAALRLGELYMVTPSLFEAREYFSTAIALMPDNPDVYLRIARNHADSQTRVSYLDQGLSKLPNAGVLHLARGHALYAIYAEDWQFERQTYYDDRLTAESDALRSYAVAQAFGAEDALMYLNLGHSEAMRERWAIAVGLYTLGLGFTPDDGSFTFEDWELYLQRAAAYLRLLDFPAAEADARAALGESEYWPVPWLLLGQALEGQGDIAGAVMAYQQHIERATQTNDMPPDPAAVAFVEAHATP
ncbi:MAG: hypothetical protein J0M33_04485 [Anaerolineae bacterium]|nr:hypothetical protein [Anaerolineae bacterium]